VFFGGIGGRAREWRVQSVGFSLDFGLSRGPISVPSRIGPNAPGLPGRIVTLAATPAASGCVQGWLSDEREPHTGQAGGIVRREAGTKMGSNQLVLTSTN
jgi:hypothetical protein